MLEAIDMDSYRVEELAAQQIQLADADATIDPVPADGGGGRPELELDLLWSRPIARIRCEEIFGSTDGPDRTRRGASARYRWADAGRHRSVPAVQRQPRLQTLAGGSVFGTTYRQPRVI
jgi:hypothetical protein